ncbi:hypothetical protein [Alistipes sp.]|uniref:hypothetical protein n=1 Tax=Alistipes sp. TaxID=1872444 RepID=UPI003AF09882
MKRIFCAQNKPAIPASPRYYLTLDGTAGDLTIENQSAEGVYLEIGVETNGTLRIVSSDARLAVEFFPGALHITVPRNAGNAPLQYAPVVLGLAEESAFRVQITILQNASPTTPADGYNITLANGTRVEMIFQDSEGTLHQIHPGFNETVTLGGVHCLISFDGPVHSVAITTSDAPGSVWSALDIEADKTYSIDTTNWLAVCAGGYDYFTVSG